MTNKIKSIIQKSIKTKQLLLGNEQLIITINKVVNEIVNTFKNDKKVLLCGNGGSAADAQHLAAELSGRFYQDRSPLYAEALHVNTSYITAVANDYSYSEIYSRLIEAKGKVGDVLVGISTSGNSENVIKAIIKGNEKKMITVGLTGNAGGKLKNLCSYLINIPSDDTPRVQEAHILVGHIICELVESELFGS